MSDKTQTPQDNIVYFSVEKMKLDPKYVSIDMADKLIASQLVAIAAQTSLIGMYLNETNRVKWAHCLHGVASIIKEVSGNIGAKNE